MELADIVSKGAKIVAPIVVGVAAAYGVHETGISQFFSEMTPEFHLFGENIAKEYLIPAGKWIGSGMAGTAAGVGTYELLDNYLDN